MSAHPPPAVPDTVASNPEPTAAPEAARVHAASEAAGVETAPEGNGVHTSPVVSEASGTPAWPRSARLALTALAVLAAAAVVLAWNTRARQDTAEQAIVKRQQEAAEQAGEARALARQAEAVTRESAAKLALLEARVAETSLQRSQLEELIQSLARSRDENLLADVEASVRVALQQAAITGSAEPLIAALRQADERLARFQQPRLERVRRAVMQDLERLKGAAVVDVPALSMRIDEAVRAVDQLPLLSSAHHGGARREAAPRDAISQPSATEGATATGWRSWVAQAWEELRGLVRVTRIDSPEAALLAPEHAFFLRENLKLRLLNARLALLSRQFDIAQADLREATAWLERYFDKGSRRVAATAESLRLVAQQSRSLGVARPDATLAALTAVAGLR